MTVSNEVPLLHTFMPAFLGFEAVTLKQVSRFRQLVWMRVRLPPPFAPRDVVIDAMGVDCLGEPEPGIMIVVRTPEPDAWPGVDLDAPSDRRDAGWTVRATVALAGAFVAPGGSAEPATSSFVNLVNIDPNLRFLPTWLFNWLNRKLVWYAFDAFRRQVKTLHTDGLSDAYLDRIRDQRDTVYDELDRRLAPWEHKKDNVDAYPPGWSNGGTTAEDGDARADDGEETKLATL
mmetsp:Transcript_162/g.615  ORF Transcript_162/g.615 Transcript_162/m.615 type:complete len:232 (-) Transcript_162:1621-2316(-)